MDFLETWSDQLTGRNQIPYPDYKQVIVFDNEMSVINGVTSGSSADEQHMVSVGIKEIPSGFFHRRDTIYDNTFIQAGVTMYHENSHFVQHVDPNTDKCLWISEISKYKNSGYYLNNWQNFLHEIYSEGNGVMSMWNSLETVYPSQLADQCMLNFVNDKAAYTKYVIPNIHGGYQSKEQVAETFEMQFQKTRETAKNIPLDFLRYKNDEIVKLISENSVVRPEYFPLYKKLIGNASCEVTDAQIASVMIMLHPMLKLDYPMVDFSDLTPEKQFGMSFPESVEDAQMRVYGSVERDICLQASDLSDVTKQLQL